MDHLEQARIVKANQIIKRLSARMMEGYYVPTREAACEKALELIGGQGSVAWGGSQSLGEVGIKEKLAQAGCTVIDRDTAKDGRERNALMRQALTCDTFLTGTNAITMQGELVNIDALGNRLAAICFGPRSVIVFAGMNKVVPSVEHAVARIRCEACPPNCIRLKADTPCAATGVCGNCVGAESLCGEILVTRNQRVKGRIKVILVGEPIGM